MEVLSWLCLLDSLLLSLHTHYLHTDQSVYIEIYVMCLAILVLVIAWCWICYSCEKLAPENKAPSKTLMQTLDSKIQKAVQLYASELWLGLLAYNLQDDEWSTSQR